MTTKIYNTIVTTKHVLSPAEKFQLLITFQESYQWELEFEETREYPVKHNRFSFVTKDELADDRNVNDMEECVCEILDYFDNCDVGLTNDEILIEIYSSEDLENPEFVKQSSFSFLINEYGYCNRYDIDENDLFEDELASIAFHSNKKAA